SRLGYTGQSCNVVPTKAVHIFVPSQHLIQKVLHFVCEFRESRTPQKSWIPARATPDCDPGLPGMTPELFSELRSHLSTAKWMSWHGFFPKGHGPTTIRSRMREPSHWDSRSPPISPMT